VEQELAEAHFWVGTLGILLYIVAIYAAGVLQGLMWRAFDSTGGRLAYPDFVETVTKLVPMYWVRVVGGTLFVSGIVMAGINLVMTWRTRPWLGMSADRLHERHGWAHALRLRLVSRADVHSSVRTRAPEPTSRSAFTRGRLLQDPGERRAKARPRATRVTASTAVPVS
jgi:heme/copper-type cytochrome/quinol oxidase subunit 1